MDYEAIDSVSTEPELLEGHRFSDFYRGEKSENWFPFLT